MKITLKLICCSLLFVVSQFAASALAGPTDTKSDAVSLTYRPDDRMVVYIGLDGDHVVRFTNVALGAVTLDSPIADVNVKSTDELTLRAKSPGVAAMVITEKTGKSLDVIVNVLDYNMLQSTLHFIDPRIKLKHHIIDGAEQLVLYGNVDKPETIIKAYSAANVFMDDRGMNYKTIDKACPQSKAGSVQISVEKCFPITNFDDPRSKIGASELISDGRRVLSLLTTRAPEK